jgi:cell division protein FtsI/penicillin-binding protein 2
MRKLFENSLKKKNRPDWRDFQTELKRKSRARNFWTCRSVRVTFISLMVVATFCGFQALPWDKSVKAPAMTAEASLPPVPAFNLTSKIDVRKFFSRHGLNNLDAKTVELPVNEQVLQVETSLDPNLQSYLLKKMDRKNSRYIGIVVMEADTGRVLALAGFDKADSDINPCLRSEFPAASIFKIVTAAAAVDHCGLKANSKMHFNGYKHTLYKSQLKEKKNRYSNTVSFKNAFAQSVNPVFGKIGKLHLGSEQLTKFADAFSFNEPLGFELPHTPSHFQVKDKPYYWAELASGFNNDTTISPLHGAVMASAVLNNGHMVEPSIVDRILSPEGETLYHWNPVLDRQAMSPEASNVLSQLMQTTIKSGTSRKSFRGYRRDKTLSRLQIGGKTGSIGNRTHDQRFDWFVGFAREPQSDVKLTVAVMVAHQDYIGIRASRYARMAMKYYFQNCLVKDNQKPANQDS